MYKSHLTLIFLSHKTTSNTLYTRIGKGDEKHGKSNESTKRTDMYP